MWRDCIGDIICKRHWREIAKANLFHKRIIERAHRIHETAAPCILTLHLDDIPRKRHPGARCEKERDQSETYTFVHKPAFCDITPISYKLTQNLSTTNRNLCSHLRR